MAERTQLKTAHQDHFADDDPFAELTRIMGFDPREPVQNPGEPAVAAEQAAGGDEAIVGDDFSIDLERELLGDLAGLDVDIPQQDASVFDDAAAAGVFDEAVAASLEDDLAGVAAHAAYEGEETSPQTDTVASVNKPLDEPGSDDFVFAAAQELEAALAHEAEAGRLDDAVSDRPAEAFAEELPFETDFELEADWQAADMQPEAEATDQFEPASEEDSNPAYVDAAYRDETLHVEAKDRSVEDIDVVPSDVEPDVDIDFTSMPLGAAHSGSEIETDLEDELQHRLTEAAKPEAVTPSDDDLEDELNALLGNAAPVAAVAEEPQVEAEGVSEGAVDFQPVAEETYADFTADEAEPVAEIPSEHSYSRGNFRVELESDVADHGEPAQEPIAFDDQPDVHFDDDAFEAAIAGSINKDAEREFEPAVDADYADHLDAAEQLHEQTDDEPQDPYAELVALTAEFSPARSAEAWPAQEAQPQDHEAGYPAEDYDPQDQAGNYQDETDYRDEDGDAAQDAQPASYEDFPDIETVDVPEQAVALADDLDIPEVVYEEEPAAPAYDDIDAEFASLLNEMNSPEPVAVTPPPAATGPSENEDQRLAAQFEQEFAAEHRAYETQDDAFHMPDIAAAAVAAAAAGTVGAGLAHTGFASQAQAGRNDADAASAQGYALRSQADRTDDLNYDPDDYDDLDVPAYHASAEARRQPSRRNLLIAGIIGAVVIVGGIGVFALGGGGDGGAPALVKADDNPIKVRPENPGGATVPNQDSKVYETVSRNSSPSEPKQETLVTTAEEPVDLAARDSADDNADDLAVMPPLEEADDALPAPSVKSEDRIEQVLRDAGEADAEIVAVAPRKVRTMVVRPDGTLVPREDPAPAAQASQIDPATTASESVRDTNAASVSSTGSETASAALGGQTTATEPVPAEAGAAPGASSPATGSQSTPSSVAVAPSRPSDQPVDIVGEVKADRVAALAPAQADGAWSMQIASQPSEAAAQSSYQDLLRRYGSVLNGHQANIVKAEIAGKGTYWRVRVPAATRNDAIKLCESYKAAGGNCFVSK